VSLSSDKLRSIEKKHSQGHRIQFTGNIKPDSVGLGGKRDVEAVDAGGFLVLELICETLTTMMMRRKSTEVNERKPAVTRI
jgi:hypothetical protein